MLQHSHPRVQLQHRHHNNQQQRHAAPGAAGVAGQAGLMAGHSQQQSANLYGNSSVGASNVSPIHFKCPQCAFMTSHGDELEKHFSDVHLTNFQQQHQLQQQQVINGLKLMHNSNVNSLNRIPFAGGGQQKLVIQSPNHHRFNNFAPPPTFSDLDESTVAAAKAILSISASSSAAQPSNMTPSASNQVGGGGGKPRRNNSLTGLGVTTNRNESIGDMILSSIDPNNPNVFPYIHQQQRTSYVSGDAGDCPTAAVMDPNFRPCFYGANVNSGSQQQQHQAGHRLQANIVQQRIANPMPQQIPQQHLNGIENLAAAVDAQNLLARSMKATAAAPPSAPSGAAAAPPQSITAADLIIYCQQLLASASHGAGHNAAPSPNAAAAANLLLDVNTFQQVMAAHQWLQTAQVASQLLGGAVNANVAPVGGGANVSGGGTYLPLRQQANDNNMAAAITAALYHQQQKQQQQAAAAAAVASIGRQNVADLTAGAGGVYPQNVGAVVGRQNVKSGTRAAPATGRQNVNVDVIVTGRQNINVDVGSSGRQNAPQISPLVMTSALRPSPRSGGATATSVETAGAGRLATTSVHEDAAIVGIGGGGIVGPRRHSMLPAINITRTRSDGSNSLMTSPTSRSGSMSTFVEEIEQRISRIISQNEVIVEPSPILAKRRTYTRQQIGQQQHQSQGLTVPLQQSSTTLPSSIQSPAAGGSNSGEPSPPLPRECRSNSLYSSFSPAMTSLSLRHQPRNATATSYPSSSSQMKTSTAVEDFGDASTSNAIADDVDDNGGGAASSSEATLRFLAQVETDTLRATFACRFCRLSVRHADDLRRHEEKCARRGGGAVSVVVGVDDKSTSPVAVSGSGSSKGPLKKRLLAAAEYEATVQGAEAIKTDGHVQPGSSSKKSQSGLPPTSRIVSQQRRATAIVAPAVLQPYTLTIVDRRRQSSSANDVQSPQQIRKPPLTVVTQCFTNAAGRRMHHVLLPTAAASAAGVDGATSSAKRSRNECFSLYAHWPQLPVCRNEALKNLSLMSACALRVHYAPLRYSQARSTGSDMRVTHSTYWQYAQLNRSLATAQRRRLEQQQEQQKSVEAHVAVDPDVAATLTPSADKSSVDRSVVDFGVAVRGGGGVADDILPPAVDVVLVPAAANDDRSTPVALSGADRRPRLGIDYFCRYYGDERQQCHIRRRHTYRRCVLPSSHRRRHRSSSTAGLWRRTSTISRRSMSVESLKAALDPDSDETMSHDGLCVVTDEEDDEGCQRSGQYTKRVGLLMELRHKLEAFGEGWKRMIRDSHMRPSCVSPFVVDHFIEDAASPLPSPSFPFYHCPSAPPLLSPNSANGERRRDDDDDAAAAGGIDEKTPDDPGVAVADLNNDRHASAFKRPSKSSTDVEAISMRDGAVAPAAQESLSHITPVRTGDFSKNLCHICDARFPNFGSYSLHMTAHSIEKPSSKRYEYTCGYCSTKCRSRNLLQKHLSTAHPQKTSQQSSGVESGKSSSKDPSQSDPLISPREKGLQSPTSQSQQQLFGSESARLVGSNDPRPFKCQYCDIAFRIHGHLAKHLRSKAHIMKLECLDKVPPGTFAMLEESKTDKFSLIDTSDCQNSLESLLKLAEEMQLFVKHPQANAFERVKTPHVTVNSVITSFASIPSTSLSSSTTSLCQTFSQSDDRGCVQSNSTVTVPLNTVTLPLNTVTVPLSTVSLPLNTTTVPPNTASVPLNLESDPDIVNRTTPPNISGGERSKCSMDLPLSDFSFPSTVIGSITPGIAHPTRLACEASTIFGDASFDLDYAPHVVATVTENARTALKPFAAVAVIVSPEAIREASSRPTAPSPSSSQTSLVCTETYDATVSPSVAYDVDRRATATTTLTQPSSSPLSPEFDVVADVRKPSTESARIPATDWLECQSPGSSRQGVARNSNFATDNANSALTCKFCPEAVFASAHDLDVHFHSDHVLMRDGSFFRCPKPNCDILFHTRQNLRNHLTFHFHGCSSSGGGSNNNNNGSGAGSGAGTGTVAGSAESDGAAKTDSSNNNRHTVVAALNRKLALFNGDGTICDSRTLNTSYCRRVSLSSARSLCDCSKCAKHSEIVSRPGRASVPDAFGSSSPQPNIVSQSPWTPLSDSDASRLSGGNDDGAASSTPPPQQPLLGLTAIKNSTIVSQRSNLLETEKQSPSSSFKRHAGELCDSDSADAKRLRIDTAIVNGDSLQLEGDDDVNVDVELEDGEVPFDEQSTQENLENATGLHSLRCIACGAQFFSVLALQRHIVAVHVAAAYASLPQSARSHLCIFCDAAFTTREKLQAHAPCRPQLLSRVTKRRYKRNHDASQQ